MAAKKGACSTDCSWSSWKYKQELHRLSPPISNQYKYGRVAKGGITGYRKNPDESSGAVGKLSKTLVISYDESC